MRVFIDCIKILILADTLKKIIPYVISEIKSNISLKRFIGLGNIPEVKLMEKNTY